MRTVILLGGSVQKARRAGGGFCTGRASGCWSWPSQRGINSSFFSPNLPTYLLPIVLAPSSEQEGTTLLRISCLPYFFSLPARAHWSCRARSSTHASHLPKEKRQPSLGCLLIDLACWSSDHATLCSIRCATKKPCRTTRPTWPRTTGRPWRT